MTIRSLLPHTPEYPSALHTLRDPPTLRVLGVYDVSAPCATVVGTRTPTDEGYGFAFELGVAMAKAGLTVVSGGALGIDQAAHLGALSVSGSTVAFIGCGLGSIQEQHRELFDAIVDGGGALVSPFSDDTVARRHHFFFRNELMALVGRSTILVECGVRSGARNTMKHAREYERPRAAVPHAPWTRGVGTGLELKLGATVLLSSSDALRLSGVPCEDDGDLTIEMIHDANPEPPTKRRKPNPKRRRSLPPNLSPLARSILRLLARVGSLATDELAESLGGGVGDLAMELLHLEVEGIVCFGPRGYELTAAYDVSKASIDA